MPTKNELLKFERDIVRYSRGEITREQLSRATPGVSTSMFRQISAHAVQVKQLAGKKK
jgi:hypothetical protein